MNNYHTQKTIRILTIMIIILLIANVASLSVIWIKSPHRPHTEQNRGEGRQLNQREMMLMKELDLDTLQRNEFLESQRFLRRNMRGYRHQLEENKNRIHDQLFSNNPDTIMINTLIDSVGKITSEMEKLRIDHFIRMKKVLSSDQLNKFRDMMHKEQDNERREGRHK